MFTLAINNSTMRLIIFLSVLFLGISCSVEEGKGGRATIKGKVFVQDFNAEGTNLLVEDYAPDWEVFIIYGDDDYYGERVTTNYEGTYEFDFLHEGTYTVFAYSKCDACANNKEAILIETEIVDKDEVVILEDLVVLD